MIIGLGSDICNIRRVEKAYERFGGRFLARCFGAEERRELDAIGGDKARFTALPTAFPGRKSRWCICPAAGRRLEFRGRRKRF